jgi:hypothetical protein
MSEYHPLRDSLLYIVEYHPRNVRKRCRKCTLKPLKSGRKKPLSHSVLHQPGNIALREYTGLKSQSCVLVLRKQATVSRFQRDL